MQLYQLNELRYFERHERTLDGHPIDWNQYDFLTMREIDKLRHELGSTRRERCVLIRGNHGLLKETAVDCVFPDVPFAEVVMALFRTGLSKGLYQGGSVHLDGRMGAGGLCRCWIAFKPAMYEVVVSRGYGGLRSYTKDGWDYYRWDDPQAFGLLKLLVEINT